MMYRQDDYEKKHALLNEVGIKACPICKKHFKGSRKFCSYSCMSQHLRAVNPPMICPVCKQTFLGHKRKYCSTVCRAKFYSSKNKELYKKKKRRNL